MPWSIADFSAVRLSCGEPLLSKATNSNLTPAGFFASWSAVNCQLLSWFWPTLANGPDSGSMKAMRTVSPFCANAAPAATTMAVTAIVLSVYFMAVSFAVQTARRVAFFVQCTGQGMPVRPGRGYRRGDSDPRPPSGGGGAPSGRRQLVILQLLAQPRLEHLAGGPERDGID